MEQQRARARLDTLRGMSGGRRGSRAARSLLLLLLLSLLLACRNEVEGPLPPEGEPAARARVTVQGSGLFKVEPRAIAALGWTLDSPLTLLFNGKALPYQSQDGALYFYLPADTPARYSDVHTLWLAHGDGAGTVKLPVQDGSGSEGESVTQLTREVRLAGEEQYSPKYIGDPWFWRTLVGPMVDEHELETPGRLAGPVEVVVRAGGVTSTPHRMTVLLDGEAAGLLEWTGDTRAEGTFSLELPAGERLTLAFEVPESESGADIAMLDEVLLRFPTAPALDEGLFLGSTPRAGAVHFDAPGSGALAWQVEPALAPLPAREEEGRTVIDAPANHQFVVAALSSAAPASVERAEGEVAIPTQGADYVAIVAPPLVEAVRPLLDLHEESGLSTLLLTPQQVYDAYTHGTVDPLAFQALLKEAKATWATPPRFLLLAGDSTYDPQGNQAEPPAAYLPSPFVDTVFGGETVSDNVIADIDEDGYPDVALGRLPARTAEQLQAYVEKATRYSREPEEGAWRERVLLAADGQESLFKSNSERLREGLPEAVEAHTVYPEAASDALAQMLPALNEGSLVVNYVGHGSVQQWGKDELLTTESVSQLTNGARLPIVINMTCLAGLFSHPTQESLAETLLWTAEGGAIAAIAPTSLTLPTNQSRLNESLFIELFRPERPAIGEALDRAKRTVPLHTPNDHDIVATFNLLGDPALRPAPMPGQEEG